MNSRITKNFIKHYKRLPFETRNQARKTYHLWKKDPHHSSLKFKRITPRQPIYSVRIGIGWRALGLLEEDAIYWFWIGSHGDYDSLLKRL